MQTITVDLSGLPPGFKYVNIHLDYGLKSTMGYTKGTASPTAGCPVDTTPNDAVNPDTSIPDIPNCQSYTLSFDDGGGESSSADSQTVSSRNAFKRDPGIGGLVLKSGTNEPVANAKVQIYDSANTLLATVYTDVDGWYMWQYKYTGKPATFTVKLPAYSLSQIVTLKSNGFLVVSFTVP